MPGWRPPAPTPPNIVRWFGARRVERFLAELADVARHADPAGLVTYASYPPTEYLDLPFADFATVNVYLHDPATFRRYLLRLQNFVGDKPLLLGELGMDTLRHGELACGTRDRWCAPGTATGLACSPMRCRRRGLLCAAWWRGAALAGDVVEGFDALARGQGLTHCEAAARADQEGKNGTP